MNYKKIYKRFVEDRRASERGLSSGYSERHHIKPIALGGSNKKTNIIRLTARDHYFAHCCLAKIHGGKMWSALFALANMTKVHAGAAYFLRGRMVSVSRVRAAKVRSENMSQLWASGLFKRNRVYGPLSAEHRKKIGAASRGRRQSADSIAKCVASRLKSSPQYEFVNVKTGQLFSGPQSQFCTLTGLSQPLASCLTRKKIKSAKGWVLRGTDPRGILNRDATVRKFQHRRGDVFVGTMFEFTGAQQFNPAVISNLVHGKHNVQSYKGWYHVGRV